MIVNVVACGCGNTYTICFRPDFIRTSSNKPQNEFSFLERAGADTSSLRTRNKKVNKFIEKSLKAGFTEGDRARGEAHILFCKVRTKSTEEREYVNLD